MQYACFADWGSFDSKKVALPAILRVSQDGCMIVLTGRVVASCKAGALGVKREMFATVSRSMVVFKLGGLVQSGVK